MTTDKEPDQLVPRSAIIHKVLGKKKKNPLFSLKLWFAQENNVLPFLTQATNGFSRIHK